MSQYRKRIEFLTDAVSELRGLPTIIIGLFLCVLSSLNYVAELNSQKPNAGGKDLTFGLLFILFFIVFFVTIYPIIRKHYERKFGRIKAKPKTFQSMLKNFLCYVPVILAFVFGGLIDGKHILPFSVMILSGSLFTFALWKLHYKGVSNLLLHLSGIFLVLSFLPWEKLYLAITVRDDFYARASFYNTFFMILWGISYIIWGFDDYRMIKTTLKPIGREEEYYESV